MPGHTPQERIPRRPSQGARPPVGQPRQRPAGQPPGGGRPRPGGQPQRPPTGRSRVRIAEIRFLDEGF
ncbi:hypothetical protein LCGC14_0396870 [marine sediment metagenome]|uniref:Uncharacterized protein n=1 Tax=marine sediment metagenome TaxID=412755 RepID=A0A0F9SY93_9ZZZZ